MTRMATAYHLEALRRQRSIDRAFEAKRILLQVYFELVNVCTTDGYR